jgi:hypothetical protein
MSLGGEEAKATFPAQLSGVRHHFKFKIPRTKSTGSTSE